jgi:hypothetical protein
MANVEKGTEKTIATASATPAKGRSARKKVYERVVESDLPADLVKLFKKDNYDLKLIRWSLHGDEDYRYLTQREKEGYEFVSADELPEWYRNSVRLVDTKGRQGMVILGDLCLMKIDSDLRQSRTDAYQADTDKQVEAVDIHVLEKKGFRNLGTRSKVVMKEPSFQE